MPPTKHVQIRVPSELLDEMIKEAARVGVYVSEWARDAVIGACARKAVPAKAPQLSGGKKLSIRFRLADYKTVEAVQRASGLAASDFFRGSFAYVLQERLDVSRPAAFVELRDAGRKKTAKKRRK